MVRMIKVNKFILVIASIITSIIICTVSSSAVYENVIYLNDVIEIEYNEQFGEVFKFDNNNIMRIVDNSDYVISYEVNSSKEDLISNEYFEISENYELNKSENENKIICSYNLESREKMEEYLKASKSLYDNGKIMNAYAAMNIMYMDGSISEIDDKSVLSFTTVNKYGTLVEYLIDCREESNRGDANDDKVVNARDCAYIASKLAEGLVDELPGCSDYNGDGKVNVRDAAAIAQYCAQYYK